jgi:hypothetical protein
MVPLPLASSCEACSRGSLWPQQPEGAQAIGRWRQKLSAEKYTFVNNNEDLKLVGRRIEFILNGV